MSLLGLNSSSGSCAGRYLVGELKSRWFVFENCRISRFATVALHLLSNLVDRSSADINETQRVTGAKDGPEVGTSRE